MVDDSVMVNDKAVSKASDTYIDSTFPKSEKLPKEIRLVVWNLVASGPRLIELECTQPRDWSYRSHAYSTVFSERVPAMLHVCSEARGVGMEQYELSFGTSWVVDGPPFERFEVTSAPKIYMNPRCDVVLPISMGEWGYDGGLMKMRLLFQSGLRRVAIEFSGVRMYRKDIVDSGHYFDEIIIYVYLVSPDYGDRGVPPYAAPYYPARLESLRLVSFNQEMKHAVSASTFKPEPPGAYGDDFCSTYQGLVKAFEISDRPLPIITFALLVMNDNIHYKYKHMIHESAAGALKTGMHSYRLWICKVLTSIKYCSLRQKSA